MELINRQDAIKALRDTFLGDTYEIDAVACGTIESLKTVEAIPIEWIEKYAELLSTIDRTFCKLQAIQIRVMLNDWYVEQANQKREQEKQNESD